ncbi:hypothetical protein F4824DRAFT_40812 [Ustulina deusta]|nr:hypothetical protein F4824DRAFT_40812 [Ustulina deusta]
MPWLLVGKYKKGGIKKRKKKPFLFRKIRSLFPLHRSRFQDVTTYYLHHGRASYRYSLPSIHMSPVSIIFSDLPRPKSSSQPHQRKKKGCPDQGCIDLEGYPCKRLSPVFATKSNHLSCRLAPLPPNTHQLTSRLSTRPLPILHNLLSFTSAHKSQQSPLFPPAAIQNFSSISPRLIRHRPVQILPPPSTCLWSPQRHHSYHGFHGREFRF